MAELSTSRSTSSLALTSFTSCLETSSCSTSSAQESEDENILVEKNTIANVWKYFGLKKTLQSKNLSVGRVCMK